MYCKNKKSKNEDTVDRILSQTQEVLVENNNQMENQNDIEDDVLANILDSGENNVDDDGLISTNEVLLEDELDEIQQDIAGIPKFDSDFKKDLKFKHEMNKEQVFNILAQSDNETWEYCVEQFDLLRKIPQPAKYNNIIEVFEQLKIVAAGKKFLLFFSKSTPILWYMKYYWNNSNVQEFIKTYFKDYKHIFVCNDKKIFKEAAKEYKNKMSAGEKINFKQLGKVPIKKAKTITETLFDELTKITTV